MFFVDTADISEIHELNDYGLLDGVTTNPSIIRAIASHPLTGMGLAQFVAEWKATRQSIC